MGLEMETVEAALEKIWDLHDRLSDVIHTISRAHFLHSIRSLPASKSATDPGGGCDVVVASKGKGGGGGGFVLVKGFNSVDEEPDDGFTAAAAAAAIEEANNLNAIRTALENLEDQLGFFHTVQLQHRAERDAAIARLEQSRILLAMRLADHKGKRYKVIEEALALVGSLHDKGHCVTPEILHISGNQSSMNLNCSSRRSILMQMLISNFSLAKNSFKLEDIGGVLGNAAMFAVSMLAFLQIHQFAFKSENQQIQDHLFYRKRNERKSIQFDRYLEGSQKKHLDVLSARG